MRAIGRSRRRLLQAAAAATATTLVLTSWAATSSAATTAGAAVTGTTAADSTGSDRKPGRPGADEPASAPLLTPDDGAYLEGTVTVAATPTAPGASVTSLRVDGEVLPGATETLGTSALRFDVGSNSADRSFGNWFEINGHRIDQPETWASERATLEVPNEYLTTGENVVGIFAGPKENTSCGTNHDDFVLSNVTLELLGETADGEENEYTYDFGDGNCGSNTSKLLGAELSFFVQGDPQATTGLTAELDTTALGNGTHELSAVTEAGATTTHTVTLNNAPAGAPSLMPLDGTVANGILPVVAAAPAGGDGGVVDVTVDGETPPAAEHLGGTAATFSFDVGSNSIDDAFHNFLRVNGHRVELGGDWADERVDVTLPGSILVPGENTVEIVTGDYGSSCGVNRDDFTVSGLELVHDGEPVPGDAADRYVMGDGLCGSNDSLREVALTYTIDAPGVSLADSLGAGDATLAFDIGANSMEARYHSYLLVNGHRVDLDERDHVSERVEITVPNQWLLAGWNRVDVIAGTLAGTSCGDNRDDYALSAPELIPAEGTATHVSMRATHNIGDGSCGSSVNPEVEADWNFHVDAPARGLLAQVRTAELPDGEHTLAATSTTGEVATRTVTTDNSGPAVAASTPAEGDRITTSVPLSVELSDDSGVVRGPDVTLDGAEIAVGDPVGPGLAAGEHTLEVRATDGLGNESVREVSFTSAGIPDVPSALTPASGTRGVRAPVTLSATVNEPDGGNVTTVFTRAEALTPTRAWQGESAGVPTTLRVPGEQRIRDTRGLAPGDGRVVPSPSAADVTYQRFDVRVRGRVTEPVLRWEGTADPARLVTLHAWNADERAWEALATRRGAAEGDTALEAAVGPEHITRGTVHAMVTGTDPFADDIDPGDPDRFADPDDYDFAMVHYTDTQYLSEGAVEGATEQERRTWGSAYTGVMDWVVDNADERKIAYVAHTGDIVENNIRTLAPGLEEQVVGEFEFASEAQGRIDAAGIPNGVVAGNHDNQSGQDPTLYNEYFGPDRYEALSEEWEDATYGGTMTPGSNENHYDLFTAGGLDFVVVGLSYGVTRDEAEWAASVFRRYPDRNGILLTHDYLEPSSSPDGRGANLGGSDGPLLYDLLVRDNDNVFLVLAGHRHGVGTNVRPPVVGDIGHGVVELLADYQFYTVRADRLGLDQVGYDPATKLRFGASFFRMLQFDVAAGEMHVDTYSPLLGEFGATEYDEDRRFNGLEDNMVLPVDLTSRTTSLETEAVVLYDPVREIGRDTVASGGTASVEWPGRLRPGRTYAWFVTARTEGGGRATASPAWFTTARK
ncbi:metallophosphoesterase [Myceligenerans pegani]|uniref:Metallophosphoesterase n=1 Tax=Myceligenerans pegani TaxID=2776917 RepID=A0ABR9N119_9MICO|nr:metallophosphoesterase [Myceligenerans sp. TRM 65318]MBE1877352.1 metallophosphoesterase [Myceligenerans sp. TRM 65318]MBE3019623.1 metallophosphoesterase [Myceligenerans sp. TRM 65318]